MREVILFVARNARHVEAFAIGESLQSVAVCHIVNGALVVLLEHLDVYDALPDKHFVGYTNHLIFAVAVEQDDIIDVGAVFYKLSFLQPGADKAFFAVNI